MRHRLITKPMLTVPAAVVICVAVVILSLVSWPNPRSAVPRQSQAELANAAGKLAFGQLDTRLDGISEIQQLMRAYPALQGAALQKLCFFIRSASPATSSDPHVAADIQAALDVIDHRDPAHDGGIVVNLDDANLTAADLTGADLAGASISGSNGADLTNADLTDANLSKADLANSYFGGAVLTGTSLAGANLSQTSFFQTPLCSSRNQPVRQPASYNCKQ